MSTAQQEALALFKTKTADLEGDRFLQVILFGSHARGEAAEGSDVDVAVILSQRPERFLDAKLALGDLAYDVLLETGVYIDPTPLSQDEWEHPEHFENPRLVENIRRDGKPIA